MGRHTTIEIRKLVIDHYKGGKSQREIAEIVEIPRGTVKNIIKRFNDEKRIASKTKISPKKLFSERDERWILHKSRNDSWLTAPKLRDMV